MSEPLGIVDRLKAAVGVVATGKLPNPLAEEPQDKSRAGLVLDLTRWARESRTFWEPVFELMREEEDFAAGRQWPGGEVDEEQEKYVGDIVQQTVNRLVASLYSQNPTPEAKRLEKMLFEVWDGSQESIRGAEAILQADVMAKAQQGNIEPRTSNLEPRTGPDQMAVAGALAVKNDYDKGMAEKALLEKVADTYRLLLKHQWRTHKPDFKVLMKQCVAQAVVSRVGFIQVGYRRDMEQNPSEDGGISLADKLAAIQQKNRELLESEEGDQAPQKEELRLMVEALNREMNGQGAAVTYEGMVYQLVAADCVLVDRNCTCLWEFLGARRVARQSFMEVSAIERRWNVSLRDTGVVLYDESNAPKKEGDSNGERGARSAEQNECRRACVWHIYDKDDGMCYVVCDGVKNFLEEPYEPEPAVERFWPLVPVTLNFQVVTRNRPKEGVTIYPRSHVRLMMPMQENINYQGNEWRAQLIGARPRKVGVKSKFDDGDLAKLSGPAQSHDCIMLNNLNPGEKISDFIQDFPVPKTHMELYDPALALQASMLATGLQPSNLGAQQSGEKATGQAIAEGSRISVDQSNIDGVNFALSVIAQMSFEMLVQEMPDATVKKIVGPGAVPVALRKAEIQEEIYLEVAAGSSGRPNQALEVAKLKEVVPLALPMLQALGVPPDVLLKKIFEVLGINVDLDELLAKARGNPATLPMQGAAMAGPSVGPSAANGLTPGQPAGNAAAMAAGVPPNVPPQQRAQVVRSANG